MTIIYPYMHTETPTAPSGQWQYASNFMTSGTAAPANGVVFFQPLDVGPFPKSFDALGCATTVAQVGGTTTTRMGLYADDGTGGTPNLVGGPLYQSILTLTTVGNQVVLLPMNNLSPSRYWMAFLYVLTSGASTTATLVTTANSSPATWSAAASLIGTVGRGLQVTAGAQTTFPTTQVAVTPVTGATCPVMAARAL